MLTTSTDPPSILRQRVTSKGGTTAEGVRVLEDGGLVELAGDCVKAATERARVMGVEMAQEVSLKTNGSRTGKMLSFDKR